MEEARHPKIAPPEDPYLARLVEDLKAFGTPEEIRELIRQGGSIHDWKERNQIVEEMIEERKWWKTFWKSAGKIGAWFIGALAFIGAIKQIIPTRYWPW